MTHPGTIGDMPDDERKEEEVLDTLGVTPLEYAAMLCPYYEVPLGPREMASYTVLEHGVCCGEECAAFTADDYLDAINGMLAKGWLTIQGEVPIGVAEDETVPRRPDSLLSPESVVFTCAGYLLHRRILLALHGRDFVDEVDAFTVHDKELKELRFYTRTKRHCEQRVRTAHQRTSDRSISGILGFPAEIESVRGPVKSGRWRPSDFLELRSGYMAAVSYRRRRRRRFNVPSLGLESWIESLGPVYIRGTIQGTGFSFGDLPRRTRATLEDKDAVFEWHFHVDGELLSSAPDGAVLEDETEPAGYRLGMRKDYSQQEIRGLERRSMLTIEQAKAIATSCAEKYLKERP